MKNFKVIDKETGKEYWISRSMAITCIVSAKDKEGRIRILVEKRGPGCPDNVGKLVLPCGYLDFDETLKEAAIREVYEETGLRIAPESLSFVGINDKVTENHQNVTVRFLASVPKVDFDIQMDSGSVNNNTKSRGGEEGEVEELKVMTLLDILENTTSSDWAFGHYELLKNVFGGK